MATWFAQLTNTAINAANQWNSLPAGGGTVLTWPPAAADVLMANGKIVQLNASTTVAEVRNDTTGGATSGGYFTFLSTGITLTANVFAGATTYCVRGQANSPNINYVVGQVTGGTAANAQGIYNTGTGTVSVTGNVFGGTANGGFGVENLTTGVITITGNVISGSVNGAYGAQNRTGTMTIAGNVLGALGAAANNSVRQINTGTLTVNGNVSADVGVGIENTSTGSVTVTGYAQASPTVAAISNAGQGIVEVGETRSASNGRGAVTGAFRYVSATAAKTLPYTVSEGQISMTVLDVAAIVPAVGDVRKGLVYGDGGYTGALDLGKRNTSMAGRF